MLLSPVNSKGKPLFRGTSCKNKSYIPVKNIHSLFTAFFLALTLFLTACRSDEVVFPSESEVVGGSASHGGLYVLNEGNMGSNKCTIDFYDFATGTYSRNIYAERNPNEVMELGDVGNDIAVYGSKLYVTVNCSHKVEVLDAATAKKIKQIDIPNCRYLAFADGNAYVSSYIGPVGVYPSSPLGAVFRIDTVTLQITGEATVGYQPEEMAVCGGKLFVANSGGYRAPDYDNTVTAISLEDFSPDYTIEVEENLLRLKADRYGNLWAASRGNPYAGKSSSLIRLSKNREGKYAVSRRFDIPCDNFAFRGDSLLYIHSSSSGNEYGSLNILTGEKTGSFIEPSVEAEIIRPYGLAVNPASGEIFLTDAKNYVSSGTLYCISGSGQTLWTARTGDIPAAIAFTDNASSQPAVPQEPETDRGAYISRVFEYRPAPGQFVNIMPYYSPGDTEADMIRKCEDAICGTNDECISLGGFGGYITFGFDHMVPNVEGEADFRLWGNAVWQSDEIRGGSAEPGIVFVSYDSNGNGVPDDEWYELAGSEYDSPLTVRDYGITYFPGQPVTWKDSRGETGTMYPNEFHSQSFWPQWAPESPMTFQGPRLAPNAIDQGGNGTNYILYSYPWGYADNYPNRFEEENSFDISMAVDSDGNSVSLPGIHFVRVMTALNQQCGHLGESSTEISKAIDLHYQSR